MHHRRLHPREKGKRGMSSDWSYPKIEKGDAAQSRFGTSKRTAAANDEVRRYEADPWNMEQWDATGDYYFEFADPRWEDWEKLFGYA